MWMRLAIKPIAMRREKTINSFRLSHLKATVTVAKVLREYALAMPENHQAVGMTTHGMTMQEPNPHPRSRVIFIHLRLCVSASAVQKNYL
jgi:hypothetical protein